MSQIELFPSTTFTSIEDALEGRKCPCCNHFSRAYKRSIHASMARDLVSLYVTAIDARISLMADRSIYDSKVEDMWLHYAHFVTGQTGDFSKLRFWGLVETDNKMKDDGNPSSGRWRITKRGISYVKGTLNVQKYAVVHNNELLALTGDFVSIRDVKGFDYDKMMKA